MKSKKKAPKSSSDSPSFVHTTSEHPFAAAAQWNLEQDYEQRPRALKKRKAEKESTRLPIKTPNGLIKQALISEQESGGDGEEAGDEDGSEWVGVAEELAEEGEIHQKTSERQRILDAKEELANIATNLNEDPEENVSLAIKLDGTLPYKKFSIRLGYFGDYVRYQKTEISQYRNWDW